MSTVVPPVVAAGRAVVGTAGFGILDMYGFWMQHVVRHGGMPSPAPGALLREAVRLVDFSKKSIRRAVLFHRVH